MKHYFVLIFTLYALFNACTKPSALLSETQKAEAEKQIREISMKWLEFWNNHNVEGLKSLWTEDGTVYRVHVEPAVGPEAIGHIYAKEFEQNPKSQSDWKTNKVIVASAGDYAVEYGKFTDIRLGPDGTGEDHGNYVTVYRNVNGTWKAYSDMGISAKPGAPAYSDIKLNPRELASQFIGKWRSVVGKDTVDIMEYQRFGEAIVATCSRMIKGHASPLFKMDAGFSAEGNQLKVFILFGSGFYLTANCQFTTEKKLTGVYLQDFNRDVIISSFEDEFTSSDEIISRLYDNNGVKIEEVKWTKVK